LDCHHYIELQKYILRLMSKIELQIFSRYTKNSRAFIKKSYGFEVDVARDTEGKENLDDFSDRIFQD
jgi:hypothetical protein